MVEIGGGDGPGLKPQQAAAGAIFLDQWQHRELHKAERIGDHGASQGPHQLSGPAPENIEAPTQRQPSPRHQGQQCQCRPGLAATGADPADRIAQYVLCFIVTESLGPADTDLPAFQGRQRFHDQPPFQPRINHQLGIRFAGGVVRQQRAQGRVCHVMKPADVKHRPGKTAVTDDLEGTVNVAVAGYQEYVTGFDHRTQAVQVGTGLATERLVPLQATADPLVEGQLSTHGDSGDGKKLSSLQQGQGPVDDRIVGIEMG